MTHSNDRHRSDWNRSQVVPIPMEPRWDECAAAPGVVRLPAGVRKPLYGESASGYILRAGCLLIDVALADDRRHVHILHYPGDPILPQTLPPALDIAMQALSDCELDRLPASDIEPMAPIGDTRRAGRTYPSDVFARSAIHSTATSRLAGEERLATLLLEMSLYLGFDAPGGRVFEQPLARKDIADLLGLNPDTLSRMMTRLRADGIISVPTRARMIVHDIPALAALTPLAESVRALHEMTAPSKAA